jgi:hypothetical protein
VSKTTSRRAALGLIGSALTAASAKAGGLLDGMYIPLGISGAQASVFVPTTNAVISSAVDKNGALVGSQLPNLGVNGNGSIFGSLILYLKENINPASINFKRVLFSAVDGITGHLLFDVTLWPGGVTGTYFDTAGRNGTTTSNLPYMVVRAISYVNNMTVNSWYVFIDAWQTGTPMILDLSMHGVVDLGYGLAVNQYFQGITPGNGYTQQKTVRFGFSNADPPPANWARNDSQVVVAWGSTNNLFSGDPLGAQAAFTIGGNILSTNTGASGITIGGVAFSDQQSNQIITQARLYSSSGKFILPQMGLTNRFGDVFNVGAAPPPIATFGTIDQSMNFGDPSYFGDNFGSSYPAMVNFSTEILDTSFQKPPATDTLVEDLTDFFSP